MNLYDINVLKNFEKTADRLGFKIGAGYSGHMCLMPKGDYNTLDATLPVYCRDTEFGFATVEQNVAYLAGWERALDYVRAMGLVTDKKMAAKVLHWNELYKKQEELREQQKTLELLKK